MTHRTEVDWVDIEKPKHLMQQAILSSRHSKIVVSKQDLDDFIGVLPVKEYLINLNTGKDFAIRDLLIEPIILPENTGAQKVLDLFKTKQTYFAIVVNEYGSFEGIITLHDIMENLVGSMPGEGVKEEPDIFIREDQSVLVSGDAPVETLSQVIEDFIIDFETIDYSTVAGFVLANINKIPRIGDKFIFSNHEIEIVDIDGNKIDKILVKKMHSK
jgi:putative hemolysin